MIFVTVGTNEQPFDRLVAAAAALRLEERLLVQYGSSTITSGPGEWWDYLPFDQVHRAMAAARAVVTHAGTGSILLARSCGRRPIVLARRAGLREAVDDHQLGLARRLDAAGIVTLLQDERALAAELARAPGEARNGLDPALRSPGAGLADELHEYLAERVRPPAA